MSVLEVCDLTVEFGQRSGGRLRAVDNLSFALREGQTLALVGESGSGKSTVVRALAQLVKRTSGEILLDGAPAGRRGQALRGSHGDGERLLERERLAPQPVRQVHSFLKAHQPA